jgi:predicted RNase H-related nuclease YkuK (DUF458 family)
MREGEQVVRKEFMSPTKGPMSLRQVFTDILEYVAAEPEMNYRLIIGTDSQPREDQVTFVSAIIVHREGKGDVTITASAIKASFIPCANGSFMKLLSA